MALHIVSPDDRLHDNLPLISLFFEDTAGTPSPEAQADVALAYGADIDARDQDGRTALMRSARYGNIVAIDYLVTHGANLEQEDREGNTALMLADDKQVGWTFGVSGLLLAYQADPCHKNHKGETPAMHFGLNTPLGRMLDEICAQKAH